MSTKRSLADLDSEYRMSLLPRPAYLRWRLIVQSLPRDELTCGEWLRKIAFINAKGGVAKTTSCVNIGAGLALGGYRILLVDLDSQGQITKSLGVQAGDGWAACLSGGCLRPDDPAQRGRVESHPRYHLQREGGGCRRRRGRRRDRSARGDGIRG